MAFVGGVVAGKFCEMAIQMAVQQLVKETRLVVNFSEDFEWLNDKLTILRGFLTDAGERSKQKEAVRKWLHKIQDSAMQAEDIVEECAVKSLYSDSNPSCGLNWNQIIFRYRIGRKIKDVKDRMSSVIKEGKLLKIASDVLAPEQASSSTLQRAEWKKSCLLPIDSHPVGIESKVQYIISLLENSALPVIAVVGMGGLGKTYLLQHVYNATKERFEISIWLSISQSYSISKLQHDIACDLDLRNEIVVGDVTEQYAAQLINAKLEGRECLIVLDDVWKPIMEENLIERLGLTIGNNCRIVITTRNKEVCRNVEAEIYEMEKLSEGDSWKLFCAHCFPNCVDNSPPHELEEVARNILRECGNLPLAIKATAASVAGIPRREWEFKLKQLREVSHLNNPMEILKLSYDCLPAHLKACFSYISFFPEDEKIGCEYLVSLWIGEGFILEEKDQWDIGWSYLYEMANLCLVEVWEEYEHGELKKYCRVHDLFHDLAIYISKGIKCVFDAEHAFTKGPSRKRSGGCYRILLRKKSMGNDVIAHSRLAGSPTLLRTLSLCNNELESIPANIFVNMRALRVLDLSWNTRLRKLPDCVGEMKLLKVLNLAGTGIEEVPRCVRRLKSLRYLDVSWCHNIITYPVWIGEVKCIEHINFGRVRIMPKGISKLSSLRILRFDIPLVLPVEHGEWLDLKDVGSMIKLQELKINVADESQWRSIEGGIIGHLVNMRHFTMEYKLCGHMDVPLFPENLKGMADLETLRLDSFAVRSSSLCSFANLRELTLLQCEWSDYPEFEKMGNLVSLVLWKNVQCRELPKAFGKASGFPKLRFLMIFAFSRLEEFPELEEGAMPCLEEFRLWGCYKLKNVPEGLELLKRLKEFNYGGTGTEEVRERLKKEGGQDWHKIKARNPHLIIADSLWR